MYVYVSTVKKIIKVSFVTINVTLKNIYMKLYDEDALRYT